MQYPSIVCNASFIKFESSWTRLCFIEMEFHHRQRSVHLRPMSSQTSPALLKFVHLYSQCIRVLFRYCGPVAMNNDETSPSPSPSSHNLPSLQTCHPSTQCLRRDVASHLGSLPSFQVFLQDFTNAESLHRSIRRLPYFTVLADST